VSQFPPSAGRHRGRRALILGLVVISITAAGCVRPEDPKVAINKVEANLIFGVKPTAEPAPTPFQAAAAEVAEVELEPQEEITFELPPPQSPVFTTIPQAKSDCEPAPPSAAAELPVEVNVTGDPQPGVYRWKVEGSITGADGASKGKNRQFEKRFVRNVQKISDTVYTFEQVQPIPGSALVAVNTIRVNTAPVSQNPDPGFNNIATVPSVGEPERGITLDRIDYLDRNGSSVQASFQPTTGVLLLPLPVQSGESYKSVAVDPKTGQTIVHEATVTRRGRIDACGELADGWLVDAKQTLTAGQGQPPQEISYSYIVGTQYGGALINERFSVVDPSSNDTITLEYTLGQLKGDPLPAGNS
jgi:hypothetical protein